MTEVTNKQKNPKILITGGGSGGHLNTATATIKYLEEQYPEIFQKLVYVGGSRGMINDPNGSLESRRIPELGVRFIAIRSGKLHRVFNFYTIKLLFGVLGGVIDSFKVISQEKPDLIFSTGGYVTVPLVIAAAFKRIPVVIHEQTIVSGLANRITSKFAQKILITFPDSKKYFNPKKCVITGNAIQADRFLTDLPADLEPAYREQLLSLINSNQAKPLIFLTGGGLGSHKLNNWVIENLAYLLDHYRFFIQTGENQLFNDLEKLIEAVSHLDPDQQKNIIVVKWFRSEAGFLLSNAELVIARPGANTVLELLARNKKAVLVPIPWSSGNEQQLNAEYFSRHQSGMIVAEKDLTTQLLPAVNSCIQLKSKETEQLVDKKAVNKIVAELLSVLK